jgi:hypothetical protein
MLGVTAATGGVPTIPECLRLAIGILLVLCGYGLAVWGTGIFFCFPLFNGVTLHGAIVGCVLSDTHHMGTPRPRRYRVVAGFLLPPNDGPSAAAESATNGRF